MIGPVIYGNQGREKSLSFLKRKYKMIVLERLGGPDDVIMQLVSVAEYCSTDWKSTFNIVENLENGEGYMVGVLGFSTASGEFLELLEYLQKIDNAHVLLQFIPALRKILGGGEKWSVKGLEKLPSVMKKIVGKRNQNLWRASYRMLMKYYWYPALVWCNEKGLTSQLSRYVIYDTLVQFKSLEEFEDVKGIDEAVYLEKFLEKRQLLIEQDEKLGDIDENRVEMQMLMVKRKMFDLVTPFSVECYQERFIIE